MSKPPHFSDDDKEVYKPEEPSIQFFEEGFGDSLSIYFEQIKSIDRLIFEYATLLDKAQPLFSGKIQVRFSKRAEARVKIRGEFYSDRIPKVGKMLKKQDGSWIFIWIEKVNLKKLENYRVSLNTPWDKPVLSILKKLSVLLLRREELTIVIKKMRMQLVYTKQGNDALIGKMQDDLLNMDSRVDWDFRINAKQILEEWYSKRR
jgi:hypothetical protein